MRLKKVKENDWELSVGCSLPGKWILHWGVSYVGDTGRSFPFLDLFPHYVS